MANTETPKGTKRTKSTPTKTASAPSSKDTGTPKSEPSPQRGNGAARNGNLEGLDVRELLTVLTSVQKGDFSVRLVVDQDGTVGRIADTLNSIIERNEQLESELIRIRDEVGEKGRISARASLPSATGGWRTMGGCVNDLITCLIQPVAEIERVIGAVAKGDLSQKMELEAEGQPIRGEFLRTGKMVNRMVDQLSSFASEVTRVAREVGTEGKLGGQARVKGVSGTWADLTDNVNSMADNLTTQVRNIAEVTTAVANGDLSKKITVDVKGEMAELKDTINTMVDQLSSFADEVTRVAREVGTEGKLGGQARVPGVSGTWKDLTENVNSMASNLTGQVRNIAEVTTAVANGNLSKKITVEARGEILELKSTINRMVDQLSAFASEVTRVAREVGTEGKLGGQAEVQGVSGTWKDLTQNVNSMASNLTAQVRGIAEVTTAVAKGDLSKKITVEVQGEIAELKSTINRMVDQLSAFASEVTRVAREVGTEGKLGGQAEVEGVSGTWADLTQNVNSMASNLTAQVRGIADVTTAVANGDLSKKITVEAQGEIQELKNTINRMVDQLSAFASEVTRVAREVGTEGKLGGQAEVQGVSGTWADLTDNVNSMADNLTTQVRNIAEVTTAVANGDLSKKITVDVKGEILELKNTINTMVDQLSSFADEVTRVAREVGTEGKLGGQARVPGVSGTWKDLTENVNSMADNLTTQVRNIAEVTTAVANGDLSKKITVEVQGEILELKNTINRMVDQLSGFASEVTRVAREVGTEGILGGQARVPGVSGTWKDLTDNVNSMADNLTTQVRGIAEVVTAVARGNLNRKLQVEAQGEIAELRDTINNMIDTLDTFAEQVTTVAREVGVEGKLGGQAEVPGASGTWRDLTDNVNRLAANLTTQVRAITEVTTAVAAGDLTKKITVEAAGEVADLKDNVNEMIRNLKETTRKNQEQDWLKTNLTKFTQLLQGQKELMTVSKMILSELAPLVNVQHGAFYTADRLEGEGEPVFRLLASYAYRERRGLNNQFRPGEGLVGQCALEKDRILITDVPEDYVQINSGLGSAPPRNIVVLPVLFEGDVKAVIELASFERFNDNHLTFLDQLTESIGIVLNSIEANMRTEALLKQSQSLTQELQSQQEELRETNQRLEQQARSLRESEDLLRRQQEELQGTNIELEEKARQLAVQNEEVERKNFQIEQARLAVEEKAEQLALTSKYKSEFLANMSHELRTPLNSMLILSRMLAENVDDSLTPKQVEYAETIYSSGSDLLGLINEILDLSKIESGAMAVDIEKVPLEGLADEVERMFREVANDRNLSFSVTVEDGVPEAVETDRKRLQQVLKNLLSNAFKFTHEGSVDLRIKPAGNVAFRSESLRDAERVVAFEVSDTGIGISEEKHKVIFEAFQQAEGAVNRTYGGTGLGLSISREIARLLGGEIHLESAPMEGSTFVLYLPVSYTAPPSAMRDEGAVTLGDAGWESESMVTMGDGNVAESGLAEPKESSDAIHSLPPGTSDSGNGDDDGNDRDADLTEERAVGATPEAGSTGDGTPVQPAETVTPVRAPEQQRTPMPDSPEAPSASQTAIAAQGGGDEFPDAKRPRQLATPVEDDRNALGPDDSVLLIVEDDPHFAGILIEIAREKGFKAVVARHAEEAMASVRRYKPRAITLDINLPGIHGLTLLDRLKNQPETRHIPIQVVSVTEELPRRKRKGAVAQLKKPVTRESVVAQIERMKTLTERPVKRLLVVEDNEIQRRLVEEFIGGDDVQMTGVARGADALTALATGEFDCALVDLGLPDMSGFELIDRIRNELKLDDLPIIVHTGRELTAEEAKLLHEQAEAVVVKDVEAFDRLLDETALHLHRVEAELPKEQRDRLERLHRPETSLAGKKVLIVDDDIRNIFALTSLLERHKMEVVYAESGRDGIEFLKKAPDIDAVLMDVMMPGMDGYETTRAIRQMEQFRDLPIIAVTAKAMKGDREKCLASGASDYITKPVNVDQLISLLRVWVGK
jgi:HAMP domain-containing protein/signal transduction histidine kinase/DNA-binding response OmpR family regulator